MTPCTGPTTNRTRGLSAPRLAVCIGAECACVRTWLTVAMYLALGLADDTTHEYDLDEEDAAWLAAHNARGPPASALTEDQLEQMISKLETLVLFDHASEAGYTPSLDDMGTLGKQPGAAAALEYWKSRRAVLKRSLLNLLKVPPAPATGHDHRVCAATLC
jgi:hypothetical protein